MCEDWQIRNGKTRIQERTIEAATGSGLSATYVYDDSKDSFQQINSAYWHSGTSTMDVDVPVHGVEQILRRLHTLGQDGSCSNALIFGMCVRVGVAS